MTTLPERLTAIRERLAAATPEPWTSKGPAGIDSDYAIIGDNNIIAESWGRAGEAYYPPAFDNAKLIANCPADLRLLCDVCEVLWDAHVDQARETGTPYGRISSEALRKANDLASGAGGRAQASGVTTYHQCNLTRKPTTKASEPEG